MQCALIIGEERKIGWLLSSDKRNDNMLITKYSISKDYDEVGLFTTILISKNHTISPTGIAYLPL